MASDEDLASAYESLRIKDEKLDELRLALKHAEADRRLGAAVRAAMPSDDELACAKACVAAQAKRPGGAAYPSPSDIAEKWLSRIESARGER